MLLVRQPPRFDRGLAWLLLRRALRSGGFVLVLVLGASITAAFAVMSRPVYRSEAVLLYQDLASPPPATSPRGTGPSPWRVEQHLREMLFSPGLLEKLITELGLEGKTVAHFGMTAAIEEMRARDLQLTLREGYSFRVSLAASSPELAQRGAARAAELLTQAYVDARVEELKEVERFLDGEKRRVEQERRKRESELASFAAKHPEVVDTGTTRNDTLLSGVSTATPPLRAVAGSPDQDEAHLQQQIDLIEKQLREERLPGRRALRAGAATDGNDPGRLRERYLELARRTRESREQAGLLASRQFQADLRARFLTHATNAGLVLLAPAQKPMHPMRSLRLAIITVGGALSLGLALAIGLCLALRDDRLRHAVDLRRFDLPPLLCEVPPDTAW